MPRKSTATSIALAKTTKALADAGEAEKRSRTARRAHEMRLEGMSWFQIAEELKIPEATATSLVAEAIRSAAQLVDEGSRHQMLAIELDRLDALQRAAWPAAMTGDTRSIDAALKIIAARTRLLGLDDASGKQVTNNTIVVPGNTTEYVAALRAMTRTAP